MFNFNIKSSKKIFFLDLVLYLIPFSIVIGSLFLNIFTIIISILFIILLITNRINFNFKYLTFLFLIIFIFLFLNNIFSVSPKNSLISSVNLIKSVIVFLAFYYSLCNIEHFEKNFTKILFFVFSFVLFDTYIQHFFEYDLFGNKVNYSNGRRLSGPFGNEYIVGAFLSKIFFLSSLFLLNFYKNKFIYFSIFLTLILVILSNERSASIMFLSGVLIYFLFTDIKLIKKIVFISLTIFFLSILITTNDKLKNHFITIPVKYFKDNHHKAHFLTAIEIFKHNVFLGTGIRTFRIECKKERYNFIKTKYIENRCSTHPHNIYLEILSETGIVGFFLIFIINIYILFFLIKFYFKEKNYILKNYILAIFCNFFILFWPLQTTGSFFSSFNGFFYFLFYAFFFNLRFKLINHTYFDTK